jgi:tetratricopeptide (TPR) repeat protein
VAPRPASPPPSTSSPTVEVRLQTLLAQTSVPTLDELVQLLGRELAEAPPKAEHAELSVRLALLMWDGYGKVSAALELIDGVEHPVATALRLQAALEEDSAEQGAGAAGRAPTALLTHARRLQTRGDDMARAELGELLLWRGAYEQAEALLVTPSTLRLRALAVWLQGRPVAAAEHLAASSHPSDLLWAALLYELEELRTGNTELGQSRDRLLHRALTATGRVSARETSLVDSPADHLVRSQRLRIIEALLQQAELPVEARLQLLRQRLQLLGGFAALEGAGPLHPDLIATTLAIAEQLELQGAPESAREAAGLLSTVARLVAAQPSAGAQAVGLGALHRSARLLERVGDFVEAAQTWSELASRAAERGLIAPEQDPHSLSATWELPPPLSQLAYLRRAAELWLLHALGLPGDPDDRDEDAEDESLAKAEALYARLCELQPTDEVTVLVRLFLLLRSRQPRGAEIPVALAQCAQAAPAGSREQALLTARSARASEALRVPTGTLAEPALELADRATVEVLARRHRRQNQYESLIADYRRLASLAAASGESTAAQQSGTYLSVATALALSFLAEAEAATGASTTLLELQQPAERYAEQPGGVLIAATRVLVLQRLARYPELTTALQTLIGRTRSPETQTYLYRQLGTHAAEHTTDFALAETCYNQVLSRRPGDVVALHALARLVQQRGETDQAVELLQQAVSSALHLPSPPSEAATGQAPSTLGLLAPRYGLGESKVPVGAQAAALLACELGALHEQKAQTASSPAKAWTAMEHAVGCYEEALRRDTRCRPAARALVALYRTLQRPTELLTAMARLLPLLRDDGQRLALLLEIGQGASDRAATGQDSPEVVEYATEQAINAFTEALAIEPAHQGALAHLISLCQHGGRWALLAETLERAPHTPAILAALREAYENLGQPADVARVREQELGQLTDRHELIAAARALAELYQRLEQPENEVRAWERLYELAPEELGQNDKVLLALERHYGETGRHSEQAALLTRALAQLGASPGAAPAAEVGEQRRSLLLRLAGVQRDSLAAPEQATATYEQIVAEWPGDRAALQALAGLYARTERSDDLKRVLGQLLEVTSEPGERSRLIQQLAELYEKLGDQAAAHKHFGEAFYLDPTNRAAFTAYERLCYRREQWTEALRMYETALKLIETQKSRSYRPADLYLRRGQVQLQYLQQVDEAAANYLRALESDAESDATQATLERIYASRNQWKELLTAYERRAQLVRDDGKRVEILRRGARVATAKLRDVDEAVRFYEKLHTVDPTDSEALDALEVHYDRTREYEKLIGLLSTRVALSVDEQQIIGLNMRIGLLCESPEGLRDHDRAITAYRHVVEQQPTHREALDAMARLFEANERWAELLDVTKRQIRLVTDRAQKSLLYFKCGSVTEAKFGKEDDAIRYYEAAVRTSATCLPALHSLRDIYIRREDWVRVTQTLELESKLWTDDKERAGILAHIGQLYLDKLKNPERAIQYYENALGVDKDCLPAHRALFAVYFARSDWPRAFQASQVLLTKANREGEPSERSAFQSRRATVALHVGQLRIACESVIMALDIWPENTTALEILATLCRHKNTGYDFALTCRELEKQYRRRGLGRCLSLLLIAQAALAERAADVDSAEALLVESTRLSVDDFLPFEAQAALYEKLRRFEAAQNVIQSFIARCDTAADRNAVLDQLVRAQLRLAEMYSEATLEADKAVVALRAVCAEEARAGGQSKVPPHLWRSARYRLAQELYLLGRYGDARGEIEGLIELATQPSPSPAPSDGRPTTNANTAITAKHAIVTATSGPEPSGPSAAKPGASAASAGRPEPSGSTAPPQELARHYGYLGRILDAQGESAAAQQAYRRAVELDPTFAPPVLALARRAAHAGDRAQAELLVRDALTQLGQRRGVNAEADQETELQLRRGMAYLLAAFDAQQAIEAFVSLIELGTQHVGAEGFAAAAPSVFASDDIEQLGPLVAWETLDDRVALADLRLHKLNDLGGARRELLRVIQRDLRHAPVYPLLIEVYERLGEPTRAQRTRELTWLLGYGGPEGLPSQGVPAVVRGARTGAPVPARPSPHRGTLTPELRRSRLLPRVLIDSQLFDLLLAMREGIEHLFPAPWPLPFDTMPLASGPTTADFRECLAGVERLFGFAKDSVLVLVAQHVPGFVQSLTVSQPGSRPGPLQVIVLAVSALLRPDAELRYLIGRALEPLRCGYASLLRLSDSEVERVVRLATALLGPPAEFDPATQDFWQLLSPAAQETITDIRIARAAPKDSSHDGVTAPGTPSASSTAALTIQDCLSALPLCADRAGLLAADDIVATIYMMARAQGQDLDATIPGLSGMTALGAINSELAKRHQLGEQAEPAESNSGILLGQVFGGTELARYYLSDSYHEITITLADTSRL